MADGASTSHKNAPVQDRADEKPWGRGSYNLFHSSHDTKVLKPTQPSPGPSLDLWWYRLVRSFLRSTSKGTSFNSANRANLGRKGKQTEEDKLLRQVPPSYAHIFLTMTLTIPRTRISHQKTFLMLQTDPTSPNLTYSALSPTSKSPQSTRRVQVVIAFASTLTALHGCSVATTQRH